MQIEKIKPNTDEKLNEKLQKLIEEKQHLLFIEEDWKVNIQWESAYRKVSLDNK